MQKSFGAVNNILGRHEDHRMPWSVPVWLHSAVEFPEIPWLRQPLYYL
jgi:hypothetical protein